VETRDQILDEAERIVLTEGPARLRVTTVARRLGMSHANVYRFFGSRQALVEAVAAKHIALGEAVLARSIATEGTVEQRLERALVDMARYKLEQVRNGAVQVVAMVLSEAPQIAETHARAQMTQVAGLLAEGVATGELAPCDPVAAAATLLDATVMVYHPALTTTAVPEDQERRVRSLAALLYAGLRA
jgi:AcrR family transcriptional regulator